MSSGARSEAQRDAVAPATADIDARRGRWLGALLVLALTLAFAAVGDLVWRRFDWHHAFIAGAALVAAMAAGRLILLKQRQSTAAAAAELAILASRVVAENNYALRAVKRGELDQLVEALNGLLAEIERRERALRQMRDELEQRMAVRTEDLARQQARIKFIFDSVPVGFTWMVLGDLSTRFVNPAHARITGVPAERCRELELYRLATHPDDRDIQDDLHRRLLAGEIDHYEVEKRYIWPDGSVHWVALTIHLYRDSTNGQAQEISTLIDITERKLAEQNLEDMHKELMRSSRFAGMAEVATGVLHNVGNVLNSVNVSATLVADQLRRSKAANIARIAAMFNEHTSDLGEFLTRDARGRMIPAYLDTLTTLLADEQKMVTAELEHLRRNVDHIKEIVSMQQAYARMSGVIETVSVPDLIEDALRINAGSLSRHDVDTIRDYQARGVITTDKHKVIQILINLVQNAKYACDESGGTDKKIVVRTTSDEAGFQIDVIDNGIGIAPENLPRIFTHGFTTRQGGHGFGLHSGAIAAKELGGSLSVQSAGPGHGATFTLRLPHTFEARP